MKKINYNIIRVVLLYIGVFFLFSIVIYKVVKVQFFLDPINTNSQPRFEVLDAQRGNILSDDGSLLATSVPLYDIYIDFSVVNDKLFAKNIKDISKKLSVLFGDKSALEYESWLKSKKEDNENKYVRLQIQVNQNELNQLKKIPIFKLDRNKGGLIIEPRLNRKHPYGQLAYRTIGRLRQYNTVGIERSYDFFLKGESGLQLKKLKKKGLWIPEDSELNRPPKTGHDIVTTINVDMQDVAQESLAQTLIKENASWGCVILMEVETGEVKVIANLTKDSLGNIKEDYNYAIGRHVAPGSTFKLASIIAGLENDKFELSDLIDLERGEVKYYDRIMKDSPHNLDKVTIAKSFIISSNVGISKIINNSYKNNPSDFINQINSLGFGAPLDLELLYPSALYIPNPKTSNWSGVTLPWMSIGYEMAISPLHMLSFYNAIANKGKMMLPIFTTSIRQHGKDVIYKHPKVIKSQICSQNTINKIIPILIDVVEEGTAKEIKNTDYKIAGKTGTTVLNYANRKEGEDKTYQASFVGFFPANKPKYSCIVVINEPKNGQVYGGKVAAPIFKELADKIYATDIDLHKALEYQNTIVDFPHIKNASSQKVAKILKDLSIPFNSTTSTYITPTISSTSILLKENNLEDSLKNNRMPNLVGMNLSDALNILYEFGFSTEVFGCGKIIYCLDENDISIEVGQKIKSSSLIKIYLG